MKKTLIAIGFLALTAGSAKAQQTYINPMPNGGFSIHTPGQPYQYVNPNGAGGYTEQTPEGPIYINPQPGGGYTVTGPGTAESNEQNGQQDVEDGEEQ
jgi:hypothetical protein